MLYTLKSPEEIQTTRIVAQALESIMDELCNGLREGSFNSPMKVNERFLFLLKGLGKDFSAPFVNVEGRDKDFYGWPICVSRNSEIVHSRPTSIPFEQLDIIKLDAGLSYQGWNADIARTVCFSQKSLDIDDPISKTQNILLVAISKCIKGNTVGNVSSCIFKEATKEGMFIISDFTGHGIGKEVHELPLIPQISYPGYLDVILREGMILCIEVILANKKTNCIVDSDKWRVLTDNGAIAFHAEAMVVINEQFTEVLAI